MSLFDQLMEQAKGIDLGAVAQRVGLTPEQVAAGARALLPQIADPNVDNHQATADVSAQTGIGHAQLSAMLPALLEQAKGLGASGGPLGNILAGLGGGGAPAAAPAAAEAPAAPAAAGGSVLDQIKSAVDRDGDGNPVNDIMNIFKS
jgi:hypothetical protein